MSRALSANLDLAPVLPCWKQCYMIGNDYNGSSATASGSLWVASACRIFAVVNCGVPEQSFD